MQLKSLKEINVPHHISSEKYKLKQCDTIIHLEQLQYQMLIRTWHNRNSHTWLVGIQRGRHCGKQYCVCPQKVKHRITIWTSNSTFRYIPKRIEVRNSDVCIPTFIAALFTVDRRWKQPKWRWKQPKCASIDPWINKMWCIQTMECYDSTYMRYLE